MKSMTGYGKAEMTLEGRTLTVELKSVNNRFLDLNLKTPKAFFFLEDTLRKEIQAVVKRGRVDVLLTYSDNSGGERKVNVDLQLAKGYVEAAKALRVEFGLVDDYQLMALMRTPDVVRPDLLAEREEVLTALMEGCAAKAVRELDAMRCKEGAALKEELGRRAENLHKLVERIAALSPKVAASYRAKVEERMREILGETPLDEAKLLNEVAIFSDKSNIDEEIARLSSHIGQMKTMLEAGEPVGRSMDFLVQELNREANTICSKANCLELTNAGLELKAEIEKIREQVQNIE